VDQILIVAVATTQLKSGNWAVVNCFALSGHSDAIRSITSAQMARSLLVAVATQVKSGNWAVVNTSHLSGHTGELFAFSPDGQLLISGSVDKTIKFGI